MYHGFFIHSSFDGHLGYIHVLPIINSASVTIMIHVTFSLLVSSGYIPRIEYASGYVLQVFKWYCWVIFLVFKEISIMSSIVAVWIDIRTSSVGGLIFLHTLSSICFLWIFLLWPFCLVWGGISSKFWFVIL